MEILEIYLKINDKEIFINQTNSIQKAISIVNEHREKNSTIKSYYNRFMHDPIKKTLTIDYGAHNAFYVIKNLENFNIRDITNEI